MTHHWHDHPDHEHPMRVCCSCHEHQLGIWYEDHTTNLWLIDWDDTKSQCRVGWNLQEMPGEDARQANWRLN